MFQGAWQFRVVLLQACPTILSSGNAGRAIGLNAMESRSSSLSSPAILLARSAPHFEHLWTIAHSPFCLTHTAMGSIADLQKDRLSPIWKSRCLLHRHFGQ